MTDTPAAPGSMPAIMRSASAVRHLSGTGVAVALFGTVSSVALAGATSPGIALAGAVFALAAAALVLRNSGELETAHAVEVSQNQLMLESVSDLITWHDASGLVTDCGGAGVVGLGLENSQLVGKGLFDRVHVADRPVYLKAISDTVHGSEPVQVAFRIRGNDDTGFRWFDMRARRIASNRKEPNAACVIAVLRDETDRRVAQEQRDKLHHDARNSSVMKGRFLATVSHELRTPLNAIIGFSQMLGNQALLPAEQEKRLEYARIIQSSGEHLLDVVNTLLDVSKIESGAMTVEIEPLDITRLVRACVDIIQMRAEEKQVEIEIVVPEALPDIMGDSRALKQVVINLLSNALKFTPSQGKIVVALVRDGAILDISVSDTGIGIAESDLPQIGNAFFQAKSSYDRDYEGTGLGLSVVRGLIGLHGGDMIIESALGVGTRIAVRIPVDGTAGASEPARIITFARAPRKVLNALAPTRLTA
jgi:two-component system, cell cycle sensor histidine kinase DivJ